MSDNDINNKNKHKKNHKNGCALKGATVKFFFIKGCKSVKFIAEVGYFPTGVSGDCLAFEASHK